MGLPITYQTRIRANHIGFSQPLIEPTYPSSRPPASLLARCVAAVPATSPASRVACRARRGSPGTRKPLADRRRRYKGRRTHSHSPMYVHISLTELDPSRLLQSIPSNKMASEQAQRKVNLPPCSSPDFICARTAADRWCVARSKSKKTASTARRRRRCARRGEVRARRRGAR